MGRGTDILLGTVVMAVIGLVALLALGTAFAVALILAVALARPAWVGYEQIRAAIARRKATAPGGARQLAEDLMARIADFNGRGGPYGMALNAEFKPGSIAAKAPVEVPRDAFGVPCLGNRPYMALAQATNGQHRYYTNINLERRAHHVSDFNRRVGTGNPDRSGAAIWSTTLIDTKAPTCLGTLCVIEPGLILVLRPKWHTMDNALHLTNRRRGLRFLDQPLGYLVSKSVAVFTSADAAMAYLDRRAAPVLARLEKEAQATGAVEAAEAATLEHYTGKQSPARHR